MDNFANGRNADFGDLAALLREESQAEGVVDQLVSEAACTILVVLRDMRDKNSEVV